MHTRFWRGNQRERDHLEVLSVDGMRMLNWMFRQCDVGVWTELIWLRIATGDWHL